MPQDGHDQQDCEQRAGKRRLRPQANAIAPHHVTFLGDDLSSQQPLCALALAKDCDFILVCKPDSHPTLYERLVFWQANDGIATCASRHWHGRFTEVSQYRSLNVAALGSTSCSSLPSRLASRRPEATAALRRYPVHSPGPDAGLKLCRPRGPGGVAA